MSAPFLDLSALVGTLDAALVPATLDQISEIFDLERAEERRARASARTLLVWSYETGVSGPAGLGNGRLLSETLACAIQLRQAAPDAGVQASASRRAIRAALFDVLEGYRPSAAWAPLRYLGGAARDPGEDPAVLYRWIEFYQTETATPTRPRA